jgi:hypothetical protein
LADGYLVLVRDDVLFRGARGGGRFIAATYLDPLSDAGEAVRLLDRVGNVIDEVPYSPLAPWPTAPNGSGPSLELITAASDHTQPSSWAASLVGGGTPGAKNSVSP